MECPICLVNNVSEIFHNDDRHMACKKCYDNIKKITDKCPFCRKKFNVELTWIMLQSFRGNEIANKFGYELPKFFKSHKERMEYVKSI